MNKVQDLNTDVADMTAESLNFWEVNYLMEKLSCKLRVIEITK